MLYKQKGFKEKYLIQNKLIIYVSFNVLYTRKLFNSKFYSYVFLIILTKIKSN